MIYINACSLNKNFDHEEYLLKCTKKKFDVAAVTATRITRNTSKPCNIRPLQPNHQQEEHYLTLQIICLIKLVMV